ncbi:anthrax toxin lethal factor-related metalloendopeptidase [Paenibacillus faecalis]|uniref:anthrax toxin lethal factor-related metalloendopeptidase n=1 Tax=Paenibacillus faecalis TaxID=2079532 RepID=UPI000D10AF09|nr:hypothetical protein [Paenibacillus faecalis]
MKKLISTLLGLLLFFGSIAPAGWMDQVHAAEAQFTGITAPIGVNVRTGPSTSSPALFVVRGNTTVQFDGWETGETLKGYWTGIEDNRWFYYVYNGRKYYMASAFVYGDPPASQPNEPSEPNQPDDPGETSHSDLISKVVKLPSGYYDVAEANKIMANIQKFGDHILQRMYNNGVEVHLVNGPITDHPSMRHLRGVTPRGWEGTGNTWDDVPGSGGNPVIVRIGYSDTGMGHGSVNLELHETAHAIDMYVLNRYSSTYQFRNVFYSEAHRLFGNDGYNSLYPEEYFAESSALYFLNSTTRARLKQYAPQTYYYIQSIYGA